MKKNSPVFRLIFIIIIIFTLYPRLHGQERDNECQKCTLFLKPLTGFNLNMGMNKGESFAFFDNKREADDLPYKKIGIEYYRVYKNVHLPNKKEVKLEGILAFNENELVFFNIKLPIGQDYTYYKKLKKILKNADPRKINAYLYETDGVEAYNETKYCSQWFGMERSEDHVNFRIFIKYGSEAY